MKLQTLIHAKVDMSDSQWDELQIEDYQNIGLADDIDARTYLDCILTSISGACINSLKSNARGIAVFFQRQYCTKRCSNY